MSAPNRETMQVLAAVNKGETFETTREALDKLGAPPASPARS
jgi:hypothetical protein